MNTMQKEFIKITREIYDKFSVMLHEPVFAGDEKKNVNAAIDSTYISYIGEYVDAFEKGIATFTGAKYAVSTINGTAALHAGLLVSGVQQDEEVITQALTFVATANAITYCGAKPVFLDVDEDTMGLSPTSLKQFLSNNTYRQNNKVYNKISGRRIAGIMPMHTFGIPARICDICEIADTEGLPVIEDAAEALGSFKRNQHMGRFGKIGTFSFNANKIITSGGGGMIITDCEGTYQKLMHITKTSKVPHKFEFYHDQIGYNYRLPNLNASVGLAQLSKLSDFLAIKQELMDFWRDFFDSFGLKVKTGQEDDKINNWLIAVQFPSRQERDAFLEVTNEADISTRPIWKLMPDMPMYKDAITDDLRVSRHLVDIIVNIPSGIPKSRISSK